MKKLLLAVLIACAGIWPAHSLRAEEKAAFFSPIPDLPVMPGLVENTEETVVFDQPDGRIVEAEADGTGDLQATAVLSFYSRLLPQLGWKGSNPYSREGESLTLTAEDTDDGVVLRLRLAPR